MICAGAGVDFWGWEDEDDEEENLELRLDIHEDLDDFSAFSEVFRGITAGRFAGDFAVLGTDVCGAEGVATSLERSMGARLTSTASGARLLVGLGSSVLF